MTSTYNSYRSYTGRIVLVVESIGKATFSMIRTKKFKGKEIFTGVQICIILKQ